MKRACARGARWRSRSRRARRRRRRQLRHAAFAARAALARTAARRRRDVGSEGFRHRVAATTRSTVAVDPSGTPFAVHATQRLDVRVLGDYFFTIGAPLLDVAAAPGSASTPGLRATAILWAGFNPGTRVLIARATLDPAQRPRPRCRCAIEVAAGPRDARRTRRR